MIQFYKKQFQWTGGEEHIERVRLRDGSPLERLCTTCCHTPLGFTGATMKSFPFIIMHVELLKYTGVHRFLPLGWRLNVSKIPVSERANFKDAPTTVLSEDVAPSFLIKLLMRMMYGIAMGNNKPDPLVRIDKKFRVLGINAAK